jgi:hypothetical protein
MYSSLDERSSAPTRTCLRPFGCAASSRARSYRTQSFTSTTNAPQEGEEGAPSKMATPHTLPLWFIVLFFLLRGLYLRVASKRQRNARSLRRASERLSCRLHDPQRGAFIAGKPCSRCSFEQQRAANAFTDLALEAWKRFRGHSVNCI